ncbi:MAG: hypothetical protein HY226_04370 [Candidatus Vogelbacteria bacterium]|nr:hypothetical protein [Candidatus Vogelbacteria bacterium]
MKDSKYPVVEGVVAKGIILGKKANAQHGLWMAKVKTKAWIDKLRARSSDSESLKKVLAENIQEQSQLAGEEIA